MVYVCARYCSGRIVLCHPRLILELPTTEDKKIVTVLDLSTMENKKNGHRFRPLHDGEQKNGHRFRPLHDGGQKNGHHLDFSTAEVL